MNDQTTERLRGVIDLFLENASRANTHKPKYWYPLSLATYGTDEILEAMDSMCSFRTTMWEKTQAFEQQFAKYIGCDHAVMVNSGSSADLLMCFALRSAMKHRMTPDAEVLVPVVTWPTQIWSAMMAGFKVKLVDVHPTRLNMDLADAEAKITENTRVIFPVHLMGIPCDIRPLMKLAHKYGLLVIEDCCEALGASYGSLKTGNVGIAGAFSFFFSHHMTTMEGGMVTTSDTELARQLRIMRAHGWTRSIDFAGEKPLEGFDDVDPRYAFVNWGFNLRPTDLQAGFGIHQLRKLPEWNDTRNARASQFYYELSKTKFFRMPELPSHGTPAWFALPVMISRDAPFKKSAITAFLEESGVETRPIVTGNVARHPVARLFPEFKGSFPGADYIHDFGFYIGLTPFTTEEQIERLASLFTQFESSL